MLRNPFLRSILLISLALVLVLPLYDVFYIFPAYQKLLMGETESDAVRFVDYLVRTLELQDKALTQKTLPQGIHEEVARLRGDASLLKLRIFSPRGQVIFSTEAGEVGTHNDNSYFHQRVARGKVYSKVVRKNHATAEGISTRRDVVETYVPVMIASGFGGAMEVYYDITDRVRGISQLNRNSRGMLILLCGGMLLLLLLALQRAGQYLAARQRAEQDLRRSNEQLEQRVAERTRQLSGEITEKSLAQAALKSALGEANAARNSIDSILRSVHDALVAIDPRQQILLLNSAAAELLEVDPEQTVGLPFTQVSMLEPLTEPIRTALAGQEVEPFDTRLGNAGQQRVLQGMLSPIQGPEGGFDGVILLLRDVTREREVDRMKSDFLAMAAHELHTPITTIMGYAELLGNNRDQFSAAQQQEFLGYIQDKAEALALLVDDLLDVSRMEAGQPIVVQLETCSLALELRQLLDRFGAKFPRRELVLQPVAPELQLTCDPGRLQQLLDNLLSNAVKYSPQGECIEVGATATPEGVLLKVTDQGIGMTAEQISHAFERFYRVDTSTTAVSGTGLGLSIVRSIVAAHHGKVWIESTPGEGTEVFCLFPVADA